MNDVVNALDPDLFEACFASWVEGLRDVDPDIVAIDGKKLALLLISNKNGDVRFVGAPIE